MPIAFLNFTLSLTPCCPLQIQETRRVTAIGDWHALCKSARTVSGSLSLRDLRGQCCVPLSFELVFILIQCNVICTSHLLQVGIAISYSHNNVGVKLIHMELSFSQYAMYSCILTV